MHFSILSWSSFHLDSTPHFFQATGCFRLSLKQRLPWERIRLDLFTMTIINPLKGIYWPCQCSNLHPPVLKFCMLNPFQNKPWFLRVCSTSLFKKNVGKGEIACNEQFLLFPQSFLLIWRTFYHFDKN